MNKATQTTSGAVPFSGLAGTYTVSADGYQPVSITISENGAKSFNLQLKPIPTSSSTTISQSAATSTHAEETSQAMLVLNVLLTTTVGNVLLAAIAVAVVVAVAIVIQPKIKRSSPRQNRTSEPRTENHGGSNPTPGAFLNL